MQLLSAKVLEADAITGTSEIVPLVPRSKERQFLAEVVGKLQALNEYESPAEPVDTYLDTQSGRYIKLLEDIVDAEVSVGMLDSASTVLLNLLRMTKAGRTRVEADIKASKLRDEIPTDSLTDEELERITGRKLNG